MARIAAILHVLQADEGELIPAETMRAACAWAPFLLAHNKHALGTAAEPDELKLARRLLARVKSNQLVELSARDALRLFPHGNGLTMEELTPALDLLLEGDWLRELPKPPTNPEGRRTSTRYAVNPAAFA